MEDWDESSPACYKEWPSTGEMTALLDGDLLPYLIGYVSSKEDYSKMLLSTELSGDALMDYLFYHPKTTAVLNEVDAKINQWVMGAKCDSLIVYMTTSREQYREDVAFNDEYKGQRTAPKPQFFYEIRRHLQEMYGAVMSNKCEADDEMSIEQSTRLRVLMDEAGTDEVNNAIKQFADSCIITIDKDLAMISGWHSNPNINKGKPFWVDELGHLELIFHEGTNRVKKLTGTGMKWFYAQTLIGDTCDNYKGLPGYGPRAAFDALDGLERVEDLEYEVLKCYEEHYGPRVLTKERWDGINYGVDYVDMFLEQARLAWMLQKRDEMYSPEYVLPWMEGKYGIS